MTRDAPSRIFGKALSRKYPLVAEFPIPSARTTEQREAVRRLSTPQIRKHDFLGARILSFVIPKGRLIGTLVEPLSSQRFVRAIARLKYLDHLSTERLANSWRRSRKMLGQWRRSQPTLGLRVSPRSGVGFRGRNAQGRQTKGV